jgi:hypothetical protein
MLRRAGLLAALTALLVPAVAGTTTAHAKKKRAPVVTRITPKKVFVGETLTIRGRHFRRGLEKNTVAFKRPGAKVVLVKADKGTTKMLKVTLPKRLEKALDVINGTPTPTRLQVRVLAAKFGKRYSKKSKSPVVGPEKPPAPPAPAAVDPNGDCDLDGQLNRVDPDDDNDLLPDTRETSLKLDQCNVDSDRDDVEDGYEYQSAQDLNDDEYHHSSNVPYPAKRPYPNPLDGTDADTDHDGDTLTLDDEYKLWRYTGTHGSVRTLTPLTYSAGKKFTKGAIAAANYDKQNLFTAWADRTGRSSVWMVPLVGLNLANTPTAGGMPSRWTTTVRYNILDLNRDGGVDALEDKYYDGDRDDHLDDGERDEDADGLPNQWEVTGCMKQATWAGIYKDEDQYYLKYSADDFQLDDEDTDGDKVLDGADDEDHDNVPNVMECSRYMAGRGAGAYPWQGFVHVFNPCLPHPKSATCNDHLVVGPGAKKWAPFDDDGTYMDTYEIKN